MAEFIDYKLQDDGWQSLFGNPPFYPPNRSYRRGNLQIDITTAPVRILKMYNLKVNTTPYGGVIPEDEYQYPIIQNQATLLDIT
jgi:hypothetical protein